MYIPVYLVYHKSTNRFKWFTTNSQSGLDGLFTDLQTGLSGLLTDLYTALDGLLTYPHTGLICLLQSHKPV